MVMAVEEKKPFNPADWPAQRCEHGYAGTYEPVEGKPGWLQPTGSKSCRRCAGKPIRAMFKPINPPPGGSEAKKAAALLDGPSSNDVEETEDVEGHEPDAS